MKRLAILAGVLVTAAVATGIALATIPDSGGMIHGCYARSGGSCA